MENDSSAFVWGMISRLCVCLFLGASLFLFIRNNQLLTYGSRIVYNPEALVMLGVLGIPFVLSVLHLVRSLWFQQPDVSPPHTAGKELS